MEGINSENIKYLSPKEAEDLGESPQHHFDLFVNEKKVGSAEIDYFSKPLPLYQLTDLYVDFDLKGKGYASKILDKVEKFLIERRKPGLLVDAIIAGDPASTLYSKRGWKEVPNGNGLRVFNWPENVSLDILSGYFWRYTDILERKDNI